MNYANIIIWVLIALAGIVYMFILALVDDKKGYNPPKSCLTCDRLSAYKTHEQIAECMNCTESDDLIHWEPRK
jgi:hypothetical protein